MQQQTFKLQDDEDEMDKRELYLSFAERVVQQTRIIVPIDQRINEPSYYRHVVERMDQLSEGDEVVYRINSEGGRLDGLLSLLDANDTTEATTIAHIQGECHSAASILALNCDNVYVSPYASMLVHFVSFGYAGKGMDVAHMVTHTLEQSNAIIVPTYRGFCTDEEIDEIIKGKQLWLGAEEIQRRLQLKLEYLSKQAEIPEEPIISKKKTK
jgi:ATP-dependent protease ClpP protease subunit